MSAIKNIYYIIPTALPTDIKDFIVGGGENSKENNNGTKAIVKRFVTDTDHSNNPVFNAFSPKTHTEILVELQKPEWTTDIEI